MPRRVSKKASPTTIPLKQPDRSGPDPSNETLLDIAAKRGLLKEEANKESQEGSTDEPLGAQVGRLGESILWSISLAMLHFTFDVLAQHQYAEEISWGELFVRGAQAGGGKSIPQDSTVTFLFMTNIPCSSVFLLLFYILHPHDSPSILTPHIPPALHQALFFSISVATGCYLIFITNEHGYYAVMKQSPPLGCMWIWSVIELDLTWALGSLVCCAGFLRYSKYSYL